MKFSRAFIASAAILGVANSAPKEPENRWGVAGAPYRIPLHADSKPDTPEAGWEIRIPDFSTGRPDMRDVVLLGPDGKEIALDGVWRGPGRSVLMLAESMPGEGAAAMLYFGGTSSRRLKSWSAKRSLLLETRRLPPGVNIATFGGWQAAWRKSTVVDGAAFVPQVFHGGNPFGDAGHYMSRYTGLIRTGDGGDITFYTLSDDVSYVTVDGRAALKWQKNQPPPLDPLKVPNAKLRVPKDFVSVEYNHAVADPPGAMAMGWDRGGKLGTIPPDAWVHPGRVRAGEVESMDGAPVPLPELVAERYLGYGNEWYVSVKASLPELPDGCQAEWLWPDGRVDQGGEVRRLWMGLDPVTLRVRLKIGTRVLDGRRVLVIPRDFEAASVNREDQLKGFLELLENEDPALLPEVRRRAGFILARDFLPASAAVRWADAWLALAKPEGGAWVAATRMSIRAIALRDPQAAMQKLTGLSEAGRAALGRDGDLMELDLRVFDLMDPLVVGLADKLGKSNDKGLARMAKIRLGDYHLLQGRMEDAIRCLDETVGDADAVQRSAPVVDRAHSLEIEELVKDKHLEEAEKRLNQWERQRPMARIEADQLLWRARVMFLAGEWKRALQDLETSLRIRPGAPEEIDVLFWKGRTLYELGKKDEARAIWAQLMKDFPKHEKAEAAKSWSEKS